MNKLGRQGTMDVAIVTTILGTVLTTSLQEAVKAISNKKNKKKVEASTESIRKNIRDVGGNMQIYQEKHKDMRAAWRYNIAQWRRLLCNIEDCVDDFNINIKQRSPEQFAKEIGKYEEDFQELSKKIEVYIRDHDGKPCPPLQGQPDSPKYHAGPKLVGIELPREDLLALVFRKLTKVISIVGSGGVGKTCLASQVYRHPEVHKSFPLRAFVSAVGKDKNAVRDEVLGQLHSHGPGGSVDNTRAFLRSTNKRCFIVVDDVDDLELGSGVINEFREVTKVDGIIILTTTVESLAEIASRNDGHVYKMTRPYCPHNHTGLNLVGIEGPPEDLLALAVPKVKVISIVGSCGVGKTCLASQLYLHSEVNKSFPLSAFVSATGKNKEDVVKQVLLRLLCHGTTASVYNTRAFLRSANMRCFIVVDDVHDRQLGHALIEEFREVTKVDGIIILTTTVQSFAESWSGHDGHVYKMMPLSAQLSTELFMRKYGREKLVPESEEFKVECDDGVPLAVVTRAAYWKQDPIPCVTVWSKFGHLDWSDTVGRMEGVLKHGYDILADDMLQNCLLYFRLFRPENSVRRGSLVRRWQAEGVEVGCRDSCKNSMEKWKTLVDRNLLCPIHVSINDGAKECRPSGAMHGYIISHKSRTEAGFARVCSGGGWPSEQVRRVSLQTDNAEALLKDGDVSRLRTLVVSQENNKAADPQKKKKTWLSTLKKEKNNKAADLSLDECGLLRVLDLEAYGGHVRIEELCNKLKLLRYLSLRSEFIRDVPQEIQELKELETLDVGKKEVVRVPADVLMLPKLKHIIGKIQGTGFPSNPENFKAKNLVTLAGFMTLHGNGFPRRIEYMKNLRKVKVFFDPKASAKSLSSRLAASITAFLPQSKHPLLEDQRRSLSIDTKDCKQLDVLGSLDNARGNLYSLKLCGTFNLDSLPSFVHENKLMGIEKLCISFDTLSWQAIIDGQDRLPLLKYLKLVAKCGSPGVSTNTSELFIKKDQFKKLERMCLQSEILPMPKIQIEDEALTNLVSLHLISRNIGPPTSMMCNSSTANKIPQLKSLKEVALQSFSPVDDNVKKAWHGAARGHPKSPQVLFI